MLSNTAQLYRAHGSGAQQLDQAFCSCLQQQVYGEFAMSHTVSAPILVTGAGGQIGSVSAMIVEQLLKHGEQVRAFVRTDDARADRLRGLGAETFVGDLFDPADVVAALRAAAAHISAWAFLRPTRTPSRLW